MSHLSISATNGPTTTGWPTTSNGPLPSGRPMTNSPSSSGWPTTSNGLSTSVRPMTTTGPAPPPPTNSEFFKMRWENHDRAFSQNMFSYFKRGLYTDLTVTTMEHETFVVHRCVLSTYSDYFRTILARLEDCEHPVIALGYIPTRHFNSLLEFMYLGEVVVARADWAGLVAAARQLGITSLLNETVNKPNPTISNNSGHPQPPQSNTSTLYQTHPPSNFPPIEEIKKRFPQLSAEALASLTSNYYRQDNPYASQQQQASSSGGYTPSPPHQRKDDQLDEDSDEERPLVVDEPMEQEEQRQQQKSPNNDKLMALFQAASSAFCNDQRATEAVVKEEAQGHVALRNGFAGMENGQQVKQDEGFKDSAADLSVRPGNGNGIEGKIKSRKGLPKKVRLSNGATSSSPSHATSNFPHSSSVANASAAEDNNTEDGRSSSSPERESVVSGEAQPIVSSRGMDVQGHFSPSATPSLAEGTNGLNVQREATPKGNGNGDSAALSPSYEDMEKRRNLAYLSTIQNFFQMQERQNNRPASATSDLNPHATSQLSPHSNPAADYNAALAHSLAMANPALQGLANPALHSLAMSHANLQALNHHASLQALALRNQTGMLQGSPMTTNGLYAQPKASEGQDFALKNLLANPVMDADGWNSRRQMLMDPNVSGNSSMGEEGNNGGDMGANGHEGGKKHKSRKTSAKLALDEHGEVIFGPNGKAMVECEECGKQLTDPSSLYRHKKTHNGDKKHVCPVCNKRFIQRYNMKQHVTTHADQMIEPAVMESMAEDLREVLIRKMKEKRF